MGNCRSIIHTLPDEEIAIIEEETGCECHQMPQIASRKSKSSDFIPDFYRWINSNGKAIAYLGVKNKPKPLFRSLTSRGYLDRDDFFSIRELAVNPLGDRIIDAFFDEVQEPDGKMKFEDFARVLAHFRPCKDNEETGVNSRRNKLKFAFAMYDLNKNGYITRHEFKVILIMMIGPHVSDQELECITDRTMKEGDYVKDGQISFEEFSRAMERLHIEELMSIRFED